MGRVVDILQIISTGAGLLSLGIALVVAVIAVKNGTMKSANEAQGSAIDAMKEEMDILRTRVTESEKKNIRLEHTIDTICEALKMRGLVISIQGEIINIHDKSSGNSTTTRIRHDATSN